MKPVPEAALEQHTAVLGKSGSGKTYAAKAAIVEPLLQRGARVCIVDPTSAWWGLRSAADGSARGFKVLVLGGDHGDLPLVPNGGAAVARLVTDQGVSLVADTGALTVGERTRWMVDFANTLYRLNRSPLYLVLDEAHVFAPQGRVPDPEAGKMLHAVNQIASGGRSRGIRLTMITQRPQKLHKDTLTTADALIAMRVTHPLDRAAVKEWIDGCGDPVQGKEVLNSLAGLARGEGWVWYPEGGHLKRTKFPRIVTFDSSATPQEGHSLSAPKAAAELDLTEIKKAMADAVREAEASDPRLLRKQIAALTKALEERPAQSMIVASGKELADAEARGFARGLEESSKAWQAWAENLRKHHASAAATWVVLLDRPPAGVVLTAAQVEHSRVAFLDGVARRAAAPRPSGAGGVPKAERLILTALAQHPQGRSKVQVAVLAGYSKNGGSFNNALGALRSKGWIDGGGENMRITPAGGQALGDYQPLPKGPALLEHWFGQLGKAERSALSVLASAYPKGLSKAEVADRAGYEADGGSFNNALGRLRTLELVVGRGELRASDNLF